MDQNEQELIEHILQAHDSALIQVVASINATQELLVKKGVVSSEELIEETRQELDKMQKSFMDKVSEMQTSEDSEEEKKEEA